jgi:pSer/pThr/pTyr-binding forkhead associated (FHA) protein
MTIPSSVQFDGRADVAEVVVEENGREILRLPLKGPTMTIGRDPACDLHLNNRTLSRRHAQIEKRAAGIWVKDLESQNGTFVNGTRIAEPRPLMGGDRIAVGQYEFFVDGVEEARRDTPVITLTGPDGPHRFMMVGEEVVIGRAPACDITIAHKSISRRHVRIAIDGDRFIAEDLGSQNGTRINNNRISGPSPFRIGDKVQMSEFTIEVDYYDAAETKNGAGQRSSHTIVVDKSDYQNVAPIDGERAGPKGGRVTVGASQIHGPADEQSGIGQEPSDEADPVEEPPARPPPTARPAPAQARPAKPSRPSLPMLTVSHRDLAERDIVVDGDCVVLGEDGSEGVASEGRSFADQAYLVFVRGPRGVSCTVAGDRRLLVVNGEPQLVAMLRQGDTLELGVLTVVFHHQG